MLLLLNNNVVSALGKTVHVDWNISVPQNKNLTAHWSIQTDVGVTSIDLWNVQSNVFDTITPDWNVSTSTSDTLTMHWNISDSTFVTIHGSWNINNLIGGSDTSRWNINDTSQDSLVGLWNVQFVFNDDLTGLWDILSTSTVGNQILAIWNVSVPQAVSVIDLWNIYDKIGKTSTEHWSINLNIGTTVHLDWNLNAALADVLTNRWNISTSTFKQLTGSWNISLQFLNHGYILVIEEAAVGAYFAIQRWNADTPVQLGERTYVGDYDVNSEIGIRVYGTDVVVIEAWHKPPTALNYNLILYRTDEDFARVTPPTSFIGLEADYGQVRFDNFGGGQLGFGPVAADMNASFNVSANQSVTMTAHYSITVPIYANNLSLVRWNISTNIADTLINRWNISVEAHNQAVARWNVAQTANKTLLNRWNVSTNINDTLTAHWAINLVALDNLTVLWNDQSLTFTLVGDEDSFKWNIEAHLAAQKILLYNISVPYALTPQLRWRINIPSGDERTSIYSIRELTRDDGLIKWNTQANFHKNLNIKWIIASVEATASDTIGISEGSLVSLNLAFARAQDIIEISDDAIIINSGIGSSTDSIIISETTLMSVSTFGLVSDTIGISEIAEAIKVWVTSSSDSIGISENVAAVVVVDSDRDPDFTLSDRIGITDFAEALIGKPVIVSINVDGQEFVTSSNKNRL